MIKSMTGYGRSEVVVGDRHFIVEMKSVNNRFLDFNIRMPQVFNPFESQIRAELKKFMERGKVDIYISYRNLSESRVHVRYDKALASEYVRELREMASDFGLDGSISISLLAGYPDIFVLESAEEDPSLLWEPLAKALDQACEQFVAARAKEGAFLKEDLTWTTSQEGHRKFSPSTVRSCWRRCRNFSLNPASTRNGFCRKQRSMLTGPASMRS